MAKFSITVQTRFIGSKDETILEVDDEDVPPDWEADKQFNDALMEAMFEMIEWNAEKLA